MSMSYVVKKRNTIIPQITDILVYLASKIIISRSNIKCVTGKWV